MAKAIRPIFIPTPDSSELVKEVSVQFEWSMGLLRAQKQKSVMSLHEQAQKIEPRKILEISTYSQQTLGVMLSAHNLQLKSGNSTGAVEQLYQKAKVVVGENPASREGGSVKGGKPTYFLFEQRQWALEPLSAFYDWLYVNAVLQNIELSNILLEFDAFSDIAFNPKKSISTQARSAALYVSLVKLKRIDETKAPDDFIRLLAEFDYMRAPDTLFSNTKI